MENDQNKEEFDLDLDIEDEQEESSENNDSKTEGDTVDYKALAEERERELKKLKRKLFVKQSPKSLQTKTESIPNELVEKVNKLDLIEQKRQFGYENGLSPEETDWIFQSTGGKPTKESLEIPFIKHGLEGYRASKRVEANTPGSSARGSVFGNKNFEELSPEDRAKAFSERIKGIK